MFFHKKLILLIIQLFVPPQVIANLKMIMGSIFVVIGAFLASLEQPFSDSMESMMEMSSQITNAINILVGLGITSGMPWLQDWYGDAILFTVNGINIAVFVGTLIVSPLRNCLFAQQFAKMKAQLQAQKIEEFTKRQAFLAAQKGGGAFDAIRRSSVVRAANGIAADVGGAAVEGAGKVSDGFSEGLQAGTVAADAAANAAANASIEVLDADNFDWSQAQIGFFSAGGAISAQYAPIAADAALGHHLGLRRPHGNEEEVHHGAVFLQVTLNHAGLVCKRLCVT